MEEEKRGFLNNLIHEAIETFEGHPDSANSDKSLLNDKKIGADYIDDMSSGGGFDDGGDDEDGSGEGKKDEDYLKWFSELTNKDILIAGGKGASLGEMFQNKFPVPPGFVVTAHAFDVFITQNNIKEKISEILSKVDVEETQDLHDASKEVRALIESKDIPKEIEEEILEAYHILSSEKIDEAGVSQDALNILKSAQEPMFVSVRSSATTEDLVDASFAGQQESFLNIKGDRQLLMHVKKCISSLYTPRAIYYRKKKGFKEGQALLAVVVQKMIDSEKSGVVFSRDPVNLNENIAIESVYGLGEGIVSGKIKPDHQIVSRDLEIKSIKVADKKIALVRNGSGDNGMVRLSEERSKMQVLTRGEIKEIANYAIRLEDHYKKPQDIEFAIEGGVVYILQSRPITTLQEGKKERGEISGNVILEGQSASPGIGVGLVKIIKSMEDLPKIKKGDVLVTEMTNPDMVVAMQKSVAIVTNEGGMTSHAAIVSREMGIPAIVGTENATTVLKDGMRITVDGSSGKVYEGEVAETKSVEIKPVVETSKIKMKVIVDLPDFAERAALSGIDSVGLTRLEGIIASMKKHPLKYEKEGKLDEYTKVLEEGIGKILEHFKKVWVRASDIRTDEYSSLEGAPEKEINPMLGFHGIRFSLKHPEILRAELKAIKNIAEKNPEKKIGIMFPQIILIEEVREAKKYFEEVRLNNMEFGVMIETPAAIQIIEEICEEVDFVSFGTNDLTQYTLAVDRNNEDVQYLYNELHPAIFSQIEKVINACNKKNVESSICGQAGSKKEMAEFLFKKGIKSISVNADAAYDISVFIKELEERSGEEERVEGERKEEDDRTKREGDERIENEKKENERVQMEKEERTKGEFEGLKRELEDARREVSIGERIREEAEELKRILENMTGEKERLRRELEEKNSVVENEDVDGEDSFEDEKEDRGNDGDEAGGFEDEDGGNGGDSLGEGEDGFEDEGDGGGLGDDGDEDGDFEDGGDGGGGFEDEDAEEIIEDVKSESIKDSFEPQENEVEDESQEGSENDDEELTPMEKSDFSKKDNAVISSENDNEAMSSEERKRLKRKKKWAKFKERKKLKREQMKLEQEKAGSGENNEWGKKGEMGSGFDSEKVDENHLEEGRDVSENHHEEIQENIGPVEPFGDTSRIDDLGEDIQEEIHDENEEEVEAMGDSEVKVEGGEVSDEFEEVGGSEDSEEERRVENKLDELEIEEDRLEEELKKEGEELGEIKDRFEEVSEGGGERVGGSGGESEVSKDERFEEVSEDELSKGFDSDTVSEGDDGSGSGGDVGGDGGDSSEDVGVYNPDSSEGNEKKKYKYDFEDWDY